MKNLKKTLISSFLLVALIFNFHIIIDNESLKSINISTNEVSASGVPLPTYYFCRMGTTTYLGDDGAVMALWCGDCLPHAILDAGSGNCRLFNKPN